MKNIDNEALLKQLQANYEIVVKKLNGEIEPIKPLSYYKLLKDSLEARIAQLKKELDSNDEIKPDK